MIFNLSLYPYHNRSKNTWVYTSDAIRYVLSNGKKQYMLCVAADKDDQFVAACKAQGIEIDFSSYSEPKQALSGENLTPWYDVPLSKTTRLELYRHITIVLFFLSAILFNIFYLYSGFDGMLLEGFRPFPAVMIMLFYVFMFYSSALTVLSICLFQNKFSLMDGVALFTNKFGFKASFCLDDLILVNNVSKVHQFLINDLSKQEGFYLGSFAQYAFRAPNKKTYYILIKPQYSDWFKEQLKHHKIEIEQSN